MKNDWLIWLKNEFKQSYFMKMKLYLNQEYLSNNSLPPRDLIFRAFELTTPQDIKAVILGQDPYHNLNQANGLAFSVNKQEKLPMSLKNIFSELKDNYSYFEGKTGDLSNWAKQGVFLLNTILTVKPNSPMSHQGIGWENFTDRVIKEINDLPQPIVFVLWGKKAQEKKVLLNNKNHQVFISSHPSPYSAYNGFFGSRVFAKINVFLIKNAINPIDWRV